jgi:hypothetical protein
MRIIIIESLLKKKFNNDISQLILLEYLIITYFNQNNKTIITPVILQIFNDYFKDNKKYYKSIANAIHYSHSENYFIKSFLVNREIIYEILNKEGSVIKLIDEEDYKNDEELILTSLKSYRHTLRFLGNKLKSDSNFTNKIIEIDNINYLFFT